jgi:hypothetical protein
MADNRLPGRETVLNAGSAGSAMSRSRIGLLTLTRSRAGACSSLWVYLETRLQSTLGQYGITVDLDHDRHRDNRKLHRSRIEVTRGGSGPT